MTRILVTTANGDTRRPMVKYLLERGHQVRGAMWPGSFGGDLFAQRTQISVRNHALESARSLSTPTVGPNYSA